MKYTERQKRKNEECELFTKLYVLNMFCFNLFLTENYVICYGFIVCKGIKSITDYGKYD